MRFFLLFIALSSTALAADWTGFDGCGLYQVKGVGRIIKNTLVIVVNEKTQSEIIFSVPILNGIKLSPYIDRPLEANLQINEAINGANGKGTIQMIKDRLPNPLNPKDTGIQLLTKSECK